MRSFASKKKTVNGKGRELFSEKVAEEQGTDLQHRPTVKTYREEKKQSIKGKEKGRNDTGGNA